MKSCHRCRLPWEEPGAPGFNNTCPRCGMSLHACANCIHFVSRGSLRCLVPQAEPVLDPMGGNRCRHFDFASTSDRTEPAQEAAFEEGRQPLDAASARRRWEELFGG